jgi:hypothetical protein
VRKSQRKTIADLVLGLIRRRRVGLAAIARGMLDLTTVRHRIKRIWRFAQNDRISLSLVTLCLVRWVVGESGPATIALDWTYLPEYVLLAAKVCVCRRAVPVAWLVMHRSAFDSERKSRNSAEEELIRRLAQAMGERPWVLVADRGFARADLLAKLQSWDIQFVIRGSGTTWADSQGFSCLLDDVPRSARRIARYEKVYYQKSRRVPLGLVVTHREPAPEPWYLLTNMEGAEEIVRLYRQRMWIEEAFRDAKTNLGLTKLWMARADRMERMMILVAIAMVLALLSTFHYRRRSGGRDPQLSTKRRGGALSIFCTGLELLYQYGFPDDLHAEPFFILLEEN